MPEPAQPTVPPQTASDAPPAWWTSPPPQGPPGLTVHIEHHYPDDPPAPPVPEAPRRRGGRQQPAAADPADGGWEWSQLWAWVRWRHAAGVLAALAPVFGGWSLATDWGRALQDCRAQESIGGAWTLGLIALAVAATVARWRPRWYTTALLVTAVFGIAAQASPFDLVTFFTGVHQ